MEEESEAFSIPLAWEDGDGDTIDIGNWEAALHAVWGDLEGWDFVVRLNSRWVVLGVAMTHSFG